jgi:hypothetical protein
VTINKRDLEEATINGCNSLGSRGRGGGGEGRGEGRGGVETELTLMSIIVTSGSQLLHCGLKLHFARDNQLAKHQKELQLIIAPTGYGSITALFGHYVLGSQLVT